MPSLCVSLKKLELGEKRYIYKGVTPFPFMIKIYCECGFGVRGVTEAHAEANLTQHKKSKLHQKMMEIKSLERTKNEQTRRK